ncbi:expressed unknown protein [Seminavis robusta]|uniref:Uncharacterized protein n=1 Tax=Seminavis robusta TaxID=568900 RepID=A0A9N8H8Q9_9STRA|nr:expressed unknown protein [Seminavis robusta]|eukprot:Sro248_g098500.1 n/a (118) ;mRNA; f:79077-79430
MSLQGKKRKMEDDKELFVWPFAKNKNKYNSNNNTVEEQTQQTLEKENWQLKIENEQLKLENQVAKRQFDIVCGAMQKASKRLRDGKGTPRAVLGHAVEELKKETERIGELNATPHKV